MTTGATGSAPEGATGGTIPRRTVLCLGLSQLMAWGVSYYLIGGFAPLIAADLGWSRAVVQGGFSTALLVMGLASSRVGAWIDRYGGRPVMVAGSCLVALGCLGLAAAHGLAAYYGAWAVLGLGMRCCLYDAAFATLARLGGPAAGRPISQITLLGGLASTVFWPVGEALAAPLGWRGALVAYAGIALLTVPLHLAIPATGRPAPAAGPAGAARMRASARPALRGRELRVAAALYALLAVLINVLNAAMSAHMIGLLIGLGLGGTLAVWIATLRGIGQSLARLCEVASGSRLHPLDLNLAATAALPACFLLALLTAAFPPAAIGFAFLYGAGNGLLTITRGTLPLVLFDPQAYGAVVGRLLAPSFLLSAAAPLAFALVIERYGERAALGLALALASAAFGAALYLRRCGRERRRAAAEPGPRQS
ncbi:MFS transporter [Roseomonas sp. NAR14]|uniref:MFS transporter n=1 Tax=Roseomonas acroporae TaxID=2937791 RepID=A0A9X1Y4E4_9PROT|nr:MFS transporter [Roseomonas acroporae]MCK8783023.1 MFS transporter [Roseomonas acroporae]